MRLAIMQPMIESLLPEPPIGLAMGFDLVGAGRAFFASIVCARFLNTYAMAHGGYVATLLD
jgi:acyl-coenzyme A thioesterase PaaI-like protein